MNEGPRRWYVYHQVNRHIGHKRVCSNKTDLVLYKRLAEKVGCCHYREGTSFIRACHAHTRINIAPCRIIISIKIMIKALSRTRIALYYFGGYNTHPFLFYSVCTHFPCMGVGRGSTYYHIVCSELESWLDSCIALPLRISLLFRPL